MKKARKVKRRILTGHYARDKGFSKTRLGELYFYTEKPVKEEGQFDCTGGDDLTIRLPENLYQKITFDNSPIKGKIIFEREEIE